jgi:hypothetical protein
MRRISMVGVSLAWFGLSAVAQQPLFPRNPAKIGGIRPGNPHPQLVNFQPVPMPPSPTAPMGIPSATQPSAPMGTTPSVQLGQPKDIGPVPGITEHRGTIVSGPGTEMGQPMIVDGQPMPSGFGVPNTCNGPFSYLNDAPACGPGGMPYGGGHLLAGRPVLGRFVQPGKWYGSAEYLLWYVNGNRLPPLLTTSAAADNGFLGAPTTRTVFGGDDFTANQRNGGRFNLGYWFGCGQRWGIDGSYFFLGSRNDSFTVASNGDPLLARPFLNANTNTQFSQLIAFPGQSSGSFQVIQESSLWGGEMNLRRFLTGSACRRFDTVAGFKYLNLHESLGIREDVNRLANGFPGIVPTVGSAIVTDRFETENQFYGGQIGLLGEMRRGRWYIDGSAKVALGVMRQQLAIDGSQTVTTAAGATTVAGGLLALPGANIGNYTQNKFAVVPEFGMNLGYHVTPNCRLFVGYNFLYASSVLRPGEQIDTTVDVTRIPNFPTQATRLSTVRPAVPLTTTEFYAQGISFGVQFKW